MHWLGLAWVFGKLQAVAAFVLYRVAAWSGTLYLIDRGRRTGRKLFYALAAAVYVASWAVLLAGTHRLWHCFARRS